MAIKKETNVEIELMMYMENWFIKFRCCDYRIDTWQAVIGGAHTDFDYIGKHGNLFGQPETIKENEIPDAVCIICDRPFIAAENVELFANTCSLGTPPALFNLMISDYGYKARP